MANKSKQQKQEETAISIEEEIKSTDEPEEKLELMKKLLANQKVAENVKQKKIYTAMLNITVVRNY